MQRLRGADLILHAGDVMTDAALQGIEAYGPPVLAVRGNVDEPALHARLPTQRLVEVAGAPIAMVHDAGPARGRLARLRARFPDAHAAVFGHSHLPLHEQADDGFQIFNPGSPTQRRRAPAHTMGLAHVCDGRVRFALVEVD
ncbi:MAG: metallophosphatase family protein [Actinomycetota bacterium]|nr:metallophosphatase family protein [Actinomycetota bacterium]